MLHMVAKLHYLSDLSQVQIAKQLGLSTATISRLLQRARAEGIVRIEVRDLVAPDALGALLAERLGLRQVSVVEAPVGALGALAAPLSGLLLAENLKPGDEIEDTQGSVSLISLLMKFVSGNSKSPDPAPEP